MTLFLIIIIIAIIFDSHASREKKAINKKYIDGKEYYINQSQHYCSVIPEEYRKIASKHDIYTLYGLSKEYIEKTLSLEYIKEIYENGYGFGGAEIEWLCITAKAYNILDTNFVGFIYNNNIWDTMPMEINQAYVNHVYKNYNNEIQKEELVLLLTCACKLKNTIVNDKYIGYYSGYHSEVVMKELNKKYNSNSLSVSSLITNLLNKVEICNS